MAAKGLVPVQPDILLAACAYLFQSGEPPFMEAARQTILDYPQNILTSTLKGELSPWVLEILGKILRDREEILEVILLNERSPQSFIKEIAHDCSERATHLIANNQERIIENPEIVLALEANPKNLKSTTDRLRQFLSLAGIEIPGDKKLVAVEAAAPAAPADLRFQEDGGAAEIEKIEEALSEEKKENLRKFIYGLSIGGKIKLSMKGNKEARGILIKDANKLVSLAVLKSPKITDNEVAMFAGMKSLADDVVRNIADNVQWTKNYAVKLSLLNNPKTPLSHSMKFLKFLNLRDLKELANSREVPAPLQKATKELVRLKMK